MGRMIAPIIIGIVFVLFVVGQVAGMFVIPNPFVRGVSVAVGIILAVAMGYTVWQRYKEIKGGEEDDIGKY